MDNKNSTILNKLKTQPDIWLFFLFLLTFSLSIRKVLFYFPIERTFNEYTGIYIYLSEIFLILTIGSWFLYLLSNKRINLSSTSMIKLWITNSTHRLSLVLLMLLVIWSFLSIAWSGNQPIAFFRSIKLLELYLFYVYIVFRIAPLFLKCLVENSENVENCLCEKVYSSVAEKEKANSNCSTCLAGRRAWNNQQNLFTIVPPASPARIAAKRAGGRGTIVNIFRVIILVALIQSIVAIGQFITQKSLGLRFLRESIISSDIPGVAKIIIDSHKYIRSYGLMPHPNILGGFLLFSIVIIWLYYKFCVIPPRKYQECSTWNILELRGKRGTDMLMRDKIFKSSKFGLKITYILSKIYPISLKSLIKGIIAVQLIALILTFSKSASLGLIVVCLYIAYKTCNCSMPAPWLSNVPRGTLDMQNKQAKHRYIRIVILIILIITVFFGFIVRLDLKTLLLQSLNERVLYLNVSRGTILANPVTGVGIGQFVWGMQHFTKNALETWQYQPVHNVFLLIWAEMGIIGIGLFLVWIWELFRDNKFQIVPPRKILNCSTWNNLESRGKRGTIKNRKCEDGCMYKPTVFNRALSRKEEKSRDDQGLNIDMKKEGISENEYILNNKHINLSSSIVLIYFKGIILGFLFIMLFDHYFWDIWQGQVLFWLVAGLVAGIGRCIDRSSIIC